MQAIHNNQYFYESIQIVFILTIHNTHMRFEILDLRSKMALRDRDRELIFTFFSRSRSIMSLLTATLHGCYTVRPKHVLI